MMLVLSPSVTFTLVPSPVTFSSGQLELRTSRLWRPSGMSVGVWNWLARADLTVSSASPRLKLI